MPSAQGLSDKLGVANKDRLTVGVADADPEDKEIVEDRMDDVPVVDEAVEAVDKTQ